MQNHNPQEAAPVEGKPTLGSNEIDYTPRPVTQGGKFKFFAIAGVILALLVLLEVFWGKHWAITEPQDS